MDLTIPGFCEAGSTGLGTGEFWTVGAPNGYSSRQPISAYFDLYDSKETPYDNDDDTLVDSSGDTYERFDFQDHDLFTAAGGTPTQPDCGAQSWHHGWWQLASGLTGGKTYRLHTYSTDPNSASDQNNSTGHNTFALWAGSTSGTPRIYGIGAMEAFVRLPGGAQSEFYLAQIEAVHAGKTMLIDLWDPGDTGNLSGSLQILQPGTTSYTPATFDYTAMRESSSGASCDSRTGRRRHLGHDEHRRLEPLQRLLADDLDSAGRTTIPRLIHRRIRSRPRAAGGRSATRWAAARRRIRPT